VCWLELIILQGTFERFRVVLHDLGFHYNVSIIAKYAGRLISRELLIHALRAAVIQHPALSMTVSTNEYPKPHFVAVEKIDLDKLIKFVQCPSDVLQRAESVDEILSEQNSLGFCADGLPLWRIIVFDSLQPSHEPAMVIAFVWHHVIGDGASGLAVHSTILEALNSADIPADGETNIFRKTREFFDIIAEDDKVNLQVDSSLVNTVPRKPLYPSMEQIFSLPKSLSARISHVIESYFLCRRARKNAEKWSGGAYNCDAPIKTRIRHLSVSASSLKKLLERCKQENTTITPFLQTVVGKVLCETFEAAQRLRCAVAISLRRFIPSRLKIEDNAMGLWVSAFHVEYSRTQLLGRGSEGRKSKHFWDEVRKNSQRIRQEIKKKDKDLSTGMLRYIPDFRSMLLNKMGKKRDDSYAITNLGCFNGESSRLYGNTGNNSSQLRISNLLFSQSCHVNGSALQFCIVSVKDGDMNIAISWQEGIVCAEDVERVLEALRKALLEFCY
jgi:hypothetical protein